MALSICAMIGGYLLKIIVNLSSRNFDTCHSLTITRFRSGDQASRLNQFFLTTHHWSHTAYTERFSFFSSQASASSGDSNVGGDETITRSSSILSDPSENIVDSDTIVSWFWWFSQLFSVELTFFSCPMSNRWCDWRRATKWQQTVYTVWHQMQISQDIAPTKFQRSWLSAKTW